MSRDWRAGSTRAWRKVRARVLQRDQYRCQLRLPGTCTGTATHVHHVHGKAVTGDDPVHLVAACAPCNLKVGNPNRHDPDHLYHWRGEHDRMAERITARAVALGLEAP